MKIKIIVLMLMCTIATSKNFACSWFSEDEAFYNLFDQNLIRDKTLQPFLLTFDNIYYNAEYWAPSMKSEDTLDYNILEWKKYFDNKIPQPYLKFLVYRSKIEELEHIISSNSFQYVDDSLNQSDYLSKKGIEALNYLIFAKKCEPFAVFAVEEERNWSYISTRKKMTKAFFMLTAKEGNILYAHTKNISIKMRIAYQLVRLSHYGGFNDDAVRYFNTYVTPLNKKDLIYYYALEQEGGALFNQKKYDQAAYAFIRVFDHTPDRKLACYTSFKISDQMSFDTALALCKTPDEKATLFVMRGYDQFSNGLVEMNNIYGVAPNSPYLELMAVREMNSSERNILSLPYNYDFSEKKNFLNSDYKTKTYLQEIIDFTKKLISDKKAKRMDFWQVYLAHLYLLHGDYELAQQTAETIRSSDRNIMIQKDRTQFSAYVASLKTIDSTAENIIYKRYLQNKNETEKAFVYEVLGHTYMQQKDLAKAFLCHNDFSGLYYTLDINIIDDLIRFFSVKGKSKFENKLIRDKIKDKNPLASLYEMKGSHYLNNDELENALIWFKKVPDNYVLLNSEKDGKYDGYNNISAKIFSCSVRSYFEDDEAKAMTDKTYKEFSFIKNKMNKRELTENLLQLKGLSLGKTETAAKANYMLGNYFYNISAWGYYRNIVYYELSNGYQSALYTFNDSDTSSGTRYNYNGGTGIYYYHDVQKPFDYFLKAETISSDNELKAKAVFQASKCELDKMFYAAPVEYDYWWDKAKQLYSAEKRPLFKELQDKYSNTKYYREITGNCKYFEYYLAHK